MVVERERERESLSVCRTCSTLKLLTSYRLAPWFPVLTQLPNTHTCTWLIFLPLWQSRNLTACVRVPKSKLGAIIGLHGVNIRAIQSQTRTNIRVRRRERYREKIDRESDTYYHTHRSSHSSLHWYSRPSYPTRRPHLPHLSLRHLPHLPPRSTYSLHLFVPPLRSTSSPHLFLHPQGVR